MRRIVLLLSLAAVVGLLALTQSGSGRPTADTSPTAQPLSPEEALADVLARVVDFEGVADEKTTMKDTLDLLAKRFDLRFVIRLRAFEYEGLKDVDGLLIADPRPIPPMKKVRLGTVLQSLLDRVPVPSGACYMVRQYGIELTTAKFQQAEICGDQFSGPFLPLVDARVTNRPLEEVVRGLVAETNLNVVFDRRVGNQARTLISVRFRQVPLDTAFLFLSDMADLDCVQRDNVFYFTSRANAVALSWRFERERPRLNEEGYVTEPGRWRKSLGCPALLAGGLLVPSGMECR